jgi:hypothetical protein
MVGNSTSITVECSILLYLRFQEGLFVEENLVATQESGPFQIGTTIDLFDQFNTSNSFHGGVVGIVSHLQRSCFQLDIATKLDNGFEWQKAIATVLSAVCPSVDVTEADSQLRSEGNRQLNPNGSGVVDLRGSGLLGEGPTMPFSANSASYDFRVHGLSLGIRGGRQMSQFDDRFEVNLVGGLVRFVNCSGVRLRSRKTHAPKQPILASLVPVLDLSTTS